MWRYESALPLLGCGRLRTWWVLAISPLRSFFLGILAGAIGIALLALHLFADHENALFDQIVAAKVENDWSDLKKLTVLTATAHDLVGPRKAIFADQKKINFRDTWLRSADVDLQTGRGACGSYTAVLARLLDRAGIPFRLLQIYCEDGQEWGCHITLDAKIDGKWMAADAMYNVVYPVEGKEVGRNWEKYAHLVPANYDMRYRYADVRYTNWTKIPVIMPATKSLLNLVAPEFASTLSIRGYLLNMYRTYEVMLLLALLGAGGIVLVFQLITRSARPRRIAAEKREAVS